MNHKNDWIDFLCFWEDDKLIGCVAMLIFAPIAIPLALVVWLCGGFKEYVGVKVYGDLSVPMEKFCKDAKKIT